MVLAGDDARRLRQVMRLLVRLVMVDAFQYLLFQPDRPRPSATCRNSTGTPTRAADRAKQMYNATDPDGWRPTATLPADRRPWP